MRLQATDDERLYENLLDRAQRAKEPWERAAEEAREVYAGRPDILSPNQYNFGTPPVNWNKFFAIVQNTVARLVQGNPRPQARPRDPVKSEFGYAAEWFNRALDAHLTVNDITPILRQVQEEASICGASFLYITPTGKLQPINFFDVYVDWQRARPHDLWAGRYVWIRRPQNFETWRDSNRDKLQEAGLDPDAIEPGGEAWPGRQVAGATMAHSFLMDEDRAGALLDRYGRPSQSTFSTEGYNGAEDGLIAPWMGYVEDEQGWKEVHMYNGRVYDEALVPELFPNPPLFPVTTAAITGGFWQPSDYIYVAPQQMSRNWMYSKILRTFALMDNPPIQVPAEDRRETHLTMPGAKWFYQRQKPEFAQFPTVPNQWFAALEEFRNDLDELVQPLALQGALQDEELSGRALRILTENASARLQLRLNAQNEMLREVARHLCLLFYQDEAQRAADTVNAQTVELRQEDPEQADLVAQALLEQELPPELGNVSPENIRSDFLFQWVMTPPRNRDEDAERFIGVLERTAKVAGGDLSLAAEVAGIITSNAEMAEEIQTALRERIGEMQQQQAAVAGEEGAPGEVTPGPEAPNVADQVREAEQQRTEARGG